MSRAVACKALSPVPDCINIITDTKKITNKLGGFCCPGKLMPHFWDGSKSPGQKVKAPGTPNSQESHARLPPSVRLSSTQKNPEPPKQWASPTCPHPDTSSTFHQTCSGISARVGGVGRCRCPHTLSPAPPFYRCGPPWTRSSGQFSVLSFFFFHCQWDLSNCFSRCNAGPCHNLLLNLKPK